MKIAICDDEPVFLKRIYDYLWQPDCCVDCFSSPLSLLESYASGTRYDVLFLDVLMSPINGIELAKKDQGIRPFCHFGVFTVCLDYAPSGYEVSAFRYLLKPVTKEALFRVMKDIYAKFEDSHAYIRTKVSTTRNYTVIQIVEKYHGSCALGCSDTEFELRITLLK